jgi:putative DNA primase/helicase
MDELARKLEDAAAAWHDHKPEPAAKHGSPVPFDDVKPINSAVDLSEVLHELCSAINRFLVLPDGAATTVALWIAHTWCLEGFDFTPRLVVCSPVMRCGKTTLLDVVRGASRRAMWAENTTTAALFRAISEWRPTIVLDEADNLLVGKDADKELHGILNGGFRRGGAVIRCTGEDFSPTTFDVFAPVAFGLIGKLSPTLMDRSIVIRMRRKMVTEQVERIQPSNLLRLFQDFRPRLARWARDNGEVAGCSTPSFPDDMGDRARDIWAPLLAIADLAGGPWGVLARTAASAILSGSQEEDVAGLMLLSDIRDVFRERGVERIPTKELLRSLIELEERPWSSWRRGRDLTARQLGGLLQSFEVSSKDLRQADGKNLKGYEFSDFAEALARYEPD